MLLLLIAVSLTSLLTFAGCCLDARERNQRRARYWRQAESYRAAQRQPVTLRCWIVEDAPAPAPALALPAPEHAAAQPAVDWAWFGLADDLPLSTKPTDAAEAPEAVIAWAAAGMTEDDFIGARRAPQPIMVPPDIAARLDQLWSAYEQTATAAAEIVAEPVVDWADAAPAPTLRPIHATLH